MPRTKQVRKRASSPTDSPRAEVWMQDFNHQASMRTRKLETGLQNMIDNYENEIDLALARIPAEIRHLTLLELLNLDLSKDADKSPEVDKNASRRMVPPTTVKKSKKTKRETGISDDGYVTEGTSSTKQHLSRIDSSSSRSAVEGAPTGKERVRTRSSTKSQTREQTKVVPQSARKRSSSAPRKINKQFTTPAPTKLDTDYDTVTPKMKRNAPLNMLRRPKDGETVLSMQGSPLLVSAVVQEKTANINVPLSNGNMMSLLPRNGLRLSQMPQLDAETVEQLKTLKGHLERVIGSS